ncbi:MAG: zinc ribbon domain-containing protein [Pygmaiobacter sp.]
MDKNVSKLISDMAQRASIVAEGARDVFDSASRAAFEKADTAKLNLELMRLRSDRETVFADIGRTFYLMNSGTLSPIDSKTPELRIETLLCEATEKDMQIQAITEKLSGLSGKVLCPGCGEDCDKDAAFCSVCGAALHDVPQDDEV